MAKQSGVCLVCGEWRNKISNFLDLKLPFFDTESSVKFYGTIAIGHYHER
ncbi:hypothetical protein N9E43_02650 [Salibacteraceae bacterium]|nr:hypothetical protein [Salibacteraceae bacterium]MDC1304863.1 hypothetical protein [Salibacteraceae bacterium]